MRRCSTGSSHQPSGSSHQPSGAQGLSASNQRRSCCRCSRCSCVDASRDCAQQPRFFCFICISKQVTCARAAVTQAWRADASQLLCWQTQKRLLLTQSRTSSGSGLISVLHSDFSAMPQTTEVRSARKTCSNTPHGAAASWQRNACIPMKSHPTRSLKCKIRDNNEYVWAPKIYIIWVNNTQNLRNPQILPLMMI